MDGSSRSPLARLRARVARLPRWGQLTIVIAVAVATYVLVRIADDHAEGGWRVVYNAGLLVCAVALVATLIRQWREDRKR